MDRTYKKDMIVRAAYKDSLLLLNYKLQLYKTTNKSSIKLKENRWVSRNKGLMFPFKFLGARLKKGFDAGMLPMK